MDNQVAQNKQIAVMIKNRNGIVFSGICSSLTSFNEVGQFDVLPLHANLISSIKQEIILRQQNDPEGRRIPCQSGILRVKDGKIEIYLGVGTVS